MTDAYLEFLRAKIKMARFDGFEIDASDVHKTLLPHQLAEKECA